jgi:hypothetical protein
MQTMRAAFGQATYMALVESESAAAACAADRQQTLSQA